MEKDALSFKELFRRWMQNDISEDDKLAFMQMAVSPSYENELAELLKDDWGKIEIGQVISSALRERIMSAANNEHAEPITAHRVHFLRTAWFRYAAAIIIVFGIGAYLWLQNPKPPVETTDSKPVPVKNDVHPGGNKAVLTLADGSTINLDSAANGTLAQQPGAVIQKTASGQIIYAFDKTLLSQSVSYNTMSTPRGGQYQLTLPDGSKVWLNAESSINFPTAFTGKTREVSITGEAYFEVSRNKEKPFVVFVGGALSPAGGSTPSEARTAEYSITVLGTSFNVNAYNDGAGAKTSLLEGSIKIGDTFIKPGQAYKKGKLTETNVQQDIAWKNGTFDFTNADLQTVMNQVSRWYDVEIVYERGIPNIRFYGKMGRDLSLMQLLRGLEAMGVKFRLERNKLIVHP